MKKISIVSLIMFLSFLSGFLHAGPLHEAVKTGKMDEVRALIKKGAKVNLKDKDGYTPLLWAVGTRNQNIVKLLIEKGANVNVKDRSGQTPLHWAVIKGYENIVELLIAVKGVKVNEKNKEEFTALHYAIADENLNIVKLLIEKGADVHSRTSTGKTALQLAIKNLRYSQGQEYKDIVELLKKAGRM